MTYFIRPIGGVMITFAPALLLSRRSPLSYRIGSRSSIPPDRGSFFHRKFDFNLFDCRFIGSEQRNGQSKPPFAFPNRHLAHSAAARAAAIGLSFAARDISNESTAHIRRLIDVKCIDDDCPLQRGRAVNPRP